MKPLLLLQNDALEQVSQGFREYSRSQGGFAWVVSSILLAGLGAILLYTLLANRNRMAGMWMFRKLARASRLARPERELLSRVARRVLPDNPPAIFVRRTLFESAVGDLLAETNLVQSVRRKVYGP